MAISTMQFEENVNELLDQVIETGLPLEILRKGKY